MYGTGSDGGSSTQAAEGTLQIRCTNPGGEPAAKGYRCGGDHHTEGIKVELGRRYTDQMHTSVHHNERQQDCSQNMARWLSATPHQTQCYQGEQVIKPGKGVQKTCTQTTDAMITTVGEGQSRDK